MATVERHDWTGLRIKELRIRLGKTQAEFAELLTSMTGRTCHRSRVAQWEGGFHRPVIAWVETFRDLDRIAPTLRAPLIDMRALLGTEDAA